MNAHTQHAHAPAPATTTDPVCGMTVDPATSKHRAEHGGRTYHFCSAGCRAKFEAAPARYTGDPKPAPPAKPGSTYTCPMHPQIRQPGPGTCPICGMALEPEQPSADAGPNPELVDFTRRFWIGLMLTLPVLAMEMGGHVLGLMDLLPRAMSNWLQLLFATPVVLWAGWPFFVRGWQSLANRSLNMFTLIALGTGIAWIFSVVATPGARVVPAGVPGGRRVGCGVLRGSRRHRGAGAAGAVAGAARPRAHRRRDPCLAGPGANGGAEGGGGWFGNRGSVG